MAITNNWDLYCKLIYCRNCRHYLLFIILDSDHFSKCKFHYTNFLILKFFNRRTLTKILPGSLCREGNMVPWRRKFKNMDLQSGKL